MGRTSGSASLLVREQQVNGDGSFCAGRLERWRELIENDDA
jgi:hypothetical protein